MVYSFWSVQLTAKYCHGGSLDCLPLFMASITLLFPLRNQACPSLSFQHTVTTQAFADCNYFHILTLLHLLCTPCLSTLQLHACQQRWLETITGPSEMSAFFDQFFQPFPNFLIVKTQIHHLYHHSSHNTLQWCSITKINGYTYMTMYERVPHGNSERTGTC